MPIRRAIPDADVVVVGAGPAGNQAALHLVQRGHKVVVVERRHAIGDKLCSGIVGAECLRRFPAEGVRVYRAAKAASVYTPSGRTLEVTRPEAQAYVLDRVAYVASFALRAQEAGATYLLGHTVREIQVQEDGVSAVVANGSGPVSLRAQAVVIASGFGYQLTRMVGLGQADDYLIGAQVEVAALGSDEIRVYVGGLAGPGGFAWLVPTSGDRALLGMLTRREPIPRLRDLIRRLRDSGIVAEVMNKPRYWAVPVKPLPHTHRDRTVVVGDAAGQVKPATGGGIYYSLLSGEIAAETLHEALGAGDLSASRLSRYEREWRRLLGAELRVGHEARRLWESLSDRQLDYLVQALAKMGGAVPLWNSPDVTFDWHGRVIGHVLRMPGVLRAASAVGVVLPKVLRRAGRLERR